MNNNKHAHYLRHICAAFLACSFVAAAWAESADTAAVAEPDATSNWKEETLTGDWGGTRKVLFDKGVDIGLTHKSDVMANITGGIKNGTVWLGHTEARIALDLDKLLGWDATTAYIHYHSDLGSKFNTHYVGGFMGEDNIEVTTNTAQFFHAWLQKNFANNRLSILAGLYPIDSEFYVTETSGVFLQPPYGMSNELAQTGKNGPPIFPMGALAVRLKATTPGGNFYAQGAITDGVPGDPNDPHGTHIKLGNGDGTLHIAELGYTPQTEAKPDENSETFHKTAIGLWRYTAKFDDLATTDGNGNPRRRHSQGAYLLSEHTLYREAGHPAQGLSGFVRFGTASADVNQADWCGSFGLRYHGLIARRDDDIAGIAVTENHASDKYRRVNHADSHETDWELTYRARVNGWLALQPSVQYIINPGMDRSLDNAWVVGARVEVVF